MSMRDMQTDQSSPFSNTSTGIFLPTVLRTGATYISICLSFLTTLLFLNTVDTGFSLVDFNETWNEHVNMQAMESWDWAVPTSEQIKVSLAWVELGTAKPQMVPYCECPGYCYSYGHYGQLSHNFWTSLAKQDVGNRVTSIINTWHHTMLSSQHPVIGWDIICFF